VGVAVTILGGSPVVRAMAVANSAMAWAVAWFLGVGVAVTTAGVTQLGGRGVAVPKRVASAVIRSEFATAVTIFSGVGVLVITT
jgi:hypothetical protein